MTNEEIIKGKLLIAKFMEYTHDEFEDDDDMTITYYCHNHLENISGKEPWETTVDDWTSWLRPDEMKFDTLWDWLMDVIEAIKATDIDDVVEEESYKYIEKIDDALTNMRIDLAFEAVVEFIKWYNTNEKN